MKSVVVSYAPPILLWRALASLVRRLLTQAESLDEFAIAVDVLVVEILQQLATTAYQLGQAAGCYEVLLVGLEVLGEVSDTITEQSHLALYAAGVGGRLAVLAEKLSLFCLV